MSSFGPHITAGACCGVIGAGLSFAFTKDPSISLCCIPIAAGIVGALTPDMDIKSKSSQCMYILFAGLALYLWYINRTDLALITLAYSIIPQFFKHRGFIHSIIFGVASSALLYYIFNQMVGLVPDITLGISLTYLLGFVSHIILDKT